MTSPNGKPASIAAVSWTALYELREAAMALCEWHHDNGLDCEPYHRLIIAVAQVDTEVADQLIGGNDGPAV